MNQTNYTTNQEENQTKRAPFRHLTIADRKVIENLFKNARKKEYKGPELTATYIASLLGFSRSTISRELKRGGYKKIWDHDISNSSRYCFDVAQRKTNDNSKRSHYKSKVEPDNIHIKNVLMIIKKENISITYAIDVYENKTGIKFPICVKTFYNYIHKNYVKARKIKANLYLKDKKQTKTAKSLQKGDNISARPEEANNRSEVGHFEGDLIVGVRNGSKECLLTLTDRETRYEISMIIKDKTTESVVNAFNDIEKQIGSDNFLKLFKTVTFDNGTEFRDILGMENSKLTGTKRLKTYFADAYKSSQRGSNENANKQLRKFFPKGTDFSQIDESKLLNAVNKINHRKRKILDGSSSVEKLIEIDNTYESIINLLGNKDPFENVLNYVTL